MAWLVFLLPGNIPAKPDSSRPVIQQHYASNELFEKEDVLTVKISGNVRDLFSDRGATPSYHPITLAYRINDTSAISIPLKAKTRGNFRKRKENCDFPPILLNFQKETCKSTLFENQDKLKLVTPCVSETYVIREYLVYKLYNLLTPKSFRARLARVSFYDDVRQKESSSFYGILLEEDEQMAQRNQTKLYARKGIRGEYSETETFLKMAVFQYMIGNVDWSVPFLHNIRIIAFDSLSIPSVVPYDFDHAGIVNAPYAMPPEELNMSSLQERRYRGYCITDMQKFADVIATFNRLKPSFYSIYTDCKLLDSRSISTTIKFLDKFYEVINNPKRLKAEFGYPCNNNVNFVIKGLEN
jgi:hypothetical protein